MGYHPTFLTYKLTVLQDAQDPNPLVRALAVRTMGCIRVHRITEYLCDPLHVALTVYLHDLSVMFLPFMFCRTRIHM